MSYEHKVDLAATAMPGGQSEITHLIRLDSPRARWNKPLIEGDGFRLSYRKLFDDVRRLAGWFASRKLRLGDRVAIVSDDDATVITLFFALIRCGITAVMLNPRGSAAELKMLTEAALPALVFADKSVIQSVSCLQDRPDVIAVEAGTKPKSVSRLFQRGKGGVSADSFPALLSGLAPSTELPEELPEETPAYILFTSGTTSRPKGVVITHRSLFAQMNTFVRQYGFNEGTRLLNVLPFHHTDGLTHGAVVSFVAGATLLRPMRFRVERLAELLDGIYRLRATHFITVPSLLALIDQISDEAGDTFQTREFKFVISTAAYLDAALWQRFENTFGVRVVNVYGLTETVCEACYCGPDDESFRYGTVGKPVDCEARVLLDDGSLAAHGGPGELALRGDNIMAGYFRMPEETAEVLRDGWFYSGDIAEIDRDGFVRIVGRKKSVIISGGYNIYPEDVTNVLRSHPLVLDAVSFGLPDPTWGEKVVACVIPNNGTAVPESDLVAHFLSQASPEKLPREFHFFEQFPRGPAGKVVLEALKSQVVQEAGTEDEPADVDGSLADRLLEVTAKAFKVDPATISLDSTPDGIESWNSLAHVEWLMALEKAYAVRFKPKDIMTIRSVRQALVALEAKTS